MPGVEPFGLLKRKGILWGDDNWGDVIDEEAPYKNRMGVMIKRFLIIPGEHLMKQYPELQKPGALPVSTPYGKGLWREYPTYWIDDRNPSRTNAIVRVDCGFDARGTPQTKRYKHLTEEIRELQEENENLSISNMQLEEDNGKLRGDKKNMIKDVVEMVTMLRGGAKHESEEDSQEEI